jgi:hypothetical protein
MNIRTLNIRNPLASVFAACTLGAVANAHAQDNTGADRPTTAPATESSGAKANGVYPAPTQGVEKGVPAATGAQATRTTQSAKHKLHRAKKPTNGAASVSGSAQGNDAKGQ